MNERQRRLEGVLQRIAAETGVLGAALVSRDGIAVADSFRRAMHKEAFSAMSATLMGAAEIALADAGAGATRRVIAEARDMTLVVMGATPDLILVVLAERALPLDRFLPLLEERATAVAELVAR